VFSTTFKNISVTTFVAEIGVPRETTDLSQVTDKLYHHKIMFQCLLHLNMYMQVWLNPDFLSELKTTIIHVFRTH
jgi:hypothetical protein